jgi:rhodanese-related sulfurtransferase
MARKATWALIISLLALAGLGASATAADPPFKVWTPADLKAQLDNPDVVVVDVRSSGDWNTSDQKIKGAIRVDQGDESILSERYGKDKTFVLYCA